MSDFVFEGSDYTIYALRSLSDMPRLTDKWLGYDTEFTGGGLRVEGAELRLAQFATEREAIVLDMKETGHAAFARKLFVDRCLFAHSSRAEVGSTWLGLGVDLSDQIYDTLTISRVNYPDNRTHRVGLKDLAPKFLGQLGEDLLRAEDELHEVFRKMYIDAGLGTKAAAVEKVMSYGFTHIDRRHPAYLKYAGLDAVAVRRLGPQLYRLADRQGVRGAISDELRNTAIANRMNLRGWKVSADELDEVDKGARQEHAKVGQQFLDETGFKASSALKYKGYFAEKFPYIEYPNWNKPNKDGVRTPKLGGEEVAELSEKYPRIKAFGILRQFKETENIVKFTGTVEKYLDPEFYIHPEVNTLGAKTGRWTVKNPGIQTASPSSGARKLFTANSPDEVIVGADLGQIEPRVAFTLAECSDLVQQMRDGIDAYTAAAITVFGPNYTKFERKLTKRIVLGTLYAAGVDTLVFQAKYTDKWKEANRDAISKARNDFNDSIPEVKALGKKLQKNDKVWLPSGRFVPFDADKVIDGRKKSFKYKGINFLCQGTARDVLMERMRELSRRGLDKFMLMAMHDELLFSVPRAILFEVTREIREVMEMGFQGTPTPTDIEVYPGNWGAKPWLVTDNGWTQEDPDLSISWSEGYELLKVA